MRYWVSLRFLLSTFVFTIILFSRNFMSSGGDRLAAFLGTRGLNVDKRHDTFLGFGGLLEEGYYDEGSCTSKRESTLYRKPSLHEPSTYLVSRLRKYESMHRKCGPNTQNYYQALKLLSSNNSGSGVNYQNFEDCKYLVWIPRSGLGNKLVSLVSTFLYALLTTRVLLIDQQVSMEGLFCEPFKNTTWILPSDFPLRSEFGGFRHGSPYSYGRIILNKMNTNASSFVYLHVSFDSDDLDMLLFCKEYQIPLQKVPWLVIRSDQYFAPSLFLTPTFDEELENLFPKKDTVFHHLGRYLFHPSNEVWGLIKRYYDAHLADAKERIGIQIRDFATTPMGFGRMKKHIFRHYLPQFAHDESIVRQIEDICNVTSLDRHMMDRVVSCFLERKLLPNVRNPNLATMNISNEDQTIRSKAVLVTSLSSSYYKNISEMYRDILGVFQPSNEGVQKSGKSTHNMKAWAEIYLLSLMDELITTPFSTFGYVARGLGGKRAWMVNGPHREMEANEPSCIQVTSMEPCFHNPPSNYHCNFETRSMVPNYVQHCEDLKWGLKLVDVHNH
ncbi:galactoside 2-alpha-L-fucosyltransferase-like [Impatiens glandulifera]|uniref:galactoside 2-alpha-L-fucosyltransferase-like n=1 Tax=Impatiens glandulifera TaxID=253017 RepID=UPI001FB10F63|nr:galactoside 2-alpha-L-fucosyltransferase-like [Impatiens glandulifera]